jgi:hypothetical protein
MLQKPKKLWLHKTGQNSNFGSENLTRVLSIVRLMCALSVWNWIVEAFTKGVYMYLSRAVLRYGHLQHLLGLGWAWDRRSQARAEKRVCAYIAINVHGRDQIYLVNPWLPCLAAWKTQLTKVRPTFTRQQFRREGCCLDYWEHTKQHPTEILWFLKLIIKQNYIYYILCNNYGFCMLILGLSDSNFGKSSK